MQSYEGEKEFIFNLSYYEAGYLNAAVVDFFHKMRAAVESDSPVLVSDERYKIAKSLWDKIESQISIGDWT